jgi:aspartate kinase
LTAAHAPATLSLGAGALPTRTEHGMLLTIKFGGTSVGDAERIRHAATLVKDLRSQGHKVAVVTSAMAGVTNRLVALAQQAAAPAEESGQRIANYFRLTKELEVDHLEAARQAIRSPQFVEDVGRVLYTERHGLDRILLGSHLLGELTPIGSDFILSAGERLCVPILTNCLRDLGIDAVGLGGDEAGIVTDNHYGQSLPLEERTRQGVREALLPLLEAERVPVVAGFYGRSEQGRLAILGRGGSDFTATLVGCAIEADEIWMLKHDVDGIKTTDPRLVPDAYTLSSVSYWIAAEMALLGAKVLHPRSVQPAARRRIPVRIASSHDPDRPGTRLVPVDHASVPTVTALTLVRGAALVRVRSREMGDEGIVPGSLVDDLRRSSIDVFASAVGFNGGRLLWLLDGPNVEHFVALLERHNSTGFQIDVERQVAVLGIVGERVMEVPGLMARLDRSLAEARTRPLTVLHGASPNSLVVALPDDERHLSIVLRFLHTELGLDQGRPGGHS